MDYLSIPSWEASMPVFVIEHTSFASTWDDGEGVYQAILSCLKDSPVVAVSFRGITSATPSFVHSAFCRLLDHLPFDEIKRRLRVTEASRQIIDMIKERMTALPLTSPHGRGACPKIPPQMRDAKLL